MLWLRTSLPQHNEGCFLESRLLNNLEFWANDGPASRGIKGKHFRGMRGHSEADEERRTYRQRKIDEDGF